MAYQPFTPENIAKRFEDLPLILSGPILRRVRADSVTVWVALKRFSAVTLSVMDAGTGEVVLCSTAVQPSKIGERLYLVAVTAGSSGPSLFRGKIYKYNLQFDGSTDLRSRGVYSTDKSGAKGLCYDTYDLPTFVIPPEDWKDLHILHGSCRKIHGEGLDALPAADTVIHDNVCDPINRPQFLFMTGDQIYADDVADGILFMLQDIGKAVLGWTDTLPGLSIPSTQLTPGRRGDVALSTLFLTPDTKEIAKSHLFHFYEFCAMYLLAWSDVLWPKSDTDFPSYREVSGEVPPYDIPPSPELITAYHQFDYQDPAVRRYMGEQAKYAEEIRKVINFKSELSLVRRILANIPCYMILDDHEVTDDWYSSANWCARVLGTDPARRVIQNALTTYAIFQAWGNTPEQFDNANSPGQHILQILRNRESPSLNVLEETTLDWFLNIPTKDHIFEPNIYHEPNSNKDTDLTALIGPTLPAGPVLHHPGVSPGKKPDCLTWHYTINAKNYQIIVLDTRNWRSYPGPMGYSPPQLLSDAAWDMHLQNSHPPQGTVPDLTLVVSPAVPLAVPIVERVQEEKRDRHNLLINDVEGWTAQTRSFQLLLSKLATRDLGFQERTPRQRKVVILSGDVHYSFAVRLQYWAPRPYASEAIGTHAIFALLTASSFKNQLDIPGSIKDTIALHDHGYEALCFFNKRDWINYLGWGNGDKTVGYLLRKDDEGVTQEVPLEVPLRWRGDALALVCIERAMIEAQAHTVKLSTPSDWRYNVGYLNSSPTESTFQQPINSSGKDSQAAAHKGQRKYSESQGPGMQIVGCNNLGEIRFTFDLNKPRIEQELWWREPEDNQPQSRTRHVISLEFNDPEELPDPNAKVGLAHG